MLNIFGVYNSKNVSMLFIYIYAMCVCVCVCVCVCSLSLKNYLHYLLVSLAQE